METSSSGNKRGKTDSMKNILRKPNKGVENCLGTNGILSKIFRKILREYNISGSSWDALMNDYLKHEYKRLSQDNVRDYTSTRGNLNKELSRNNMTWKVLCNKGLRFLKVRRFKIVFILEHENGQISQVEEVIEVPKTPDGTNGEVSSDTQKTMDQNIIDNNKIIDRIGSSAKRMLAAEKTNHDE